MAWIYLLIAGAAEVIWAFFLKYSQGFTQLIPSVIAVIFIIVSFILFSKAVIRVPIGTAYAVFTGIGAAGTVIIGLIFGEALSIRKVVFLILLSIGIIGLKLTSSEDSEEKGETP